MFADNSIIHGTYVDGTQVSDITLKTLRIEAREFMSVCIGVREDTAHVGGLNIFGSRFGNYPQDILMRRWFRG